MKSPEEEKKKSSGDEFGGHISTGYVYFGVVLPGNDMESRCLIL